MRRGFGKYIAKGGFQSEREIIGSGVWQLNKGILLLKGGRGIFSAGQTIVMLIRRLFLMEPLLSHCHMDILYRAAGWHDAPATCTFFHNANGIFQKFSLKILCMSTAAGDKIVHNRISHWQS